MPSRSTNAPKSTMFEICPSTTSPGCRRSRICWRTSLRSSSSTARRESTTLLRERLSSITLRLDLRAHVLVEVRHAADVDQRGGQEAAHAEVDDQAALDDLDDRALDRLAGLGGGFDAPPRLLEAGALLGHDQAAVLILLGHDDRVDLLAEVDLLVGIDRLADRQLVRGDDALGLVADVDEDLVLVDPHDVARDDLALLDRAERRVVVGDDLPVDFEQQSVRPLDHVGLGVLDQRLHRPKPSAAVSLPMGARMIADACASDQAGSASAPPWQRDCDVLVCGASFAGLAVARELAGSRRAGARDRPLRARRAPDLGLRDADAVAGGARSDGLAAPDLRRARRAHAASAPRRWPLPWSFSTFDYRELCALLWEQADAGARSSSRPPPSPAATASPCTPTAASCARR